MNNNNMLKFSQIIKNVIKPKKQRALVRIYGIGVNMRKKKEEFLFSNELMPWNIRECLLIDMMAL